MTDNRKAREREIEHPENLYREIFDTTATAMAICEEDKTISMVNRRFVELLGYSKREIEGKKKWMEIVQRGDLKRMEEYHKQRRMKGGRAPKTYEGRAIDKNGNVRHILITVSMIAGTSRNIASLMDLTDRKRAEAELNASRELIEKVFDNVNDAIAVIDTASFEIVGANRSFLKTWGLKEIEAIGNPCYRITNDRTKPCTEPEDACPLLVTINSGETTRVDHVHYTGNGQQKFFEITAIPLRNGNGDIDRVIHSAHDITDRVLAEAKTRESEEKFKAIFEGAMAGIAIIDMDENRIHSSNRMFATMFGYTRKEIEKLGIQDFHPEGEMPNLRKLFDRESKNGASHVENIPLKKKDGSVLYGNIGISRVAIGGKEYLMGIFHDITEQRRAEEELRESEERYRDLFENASDLIQSVGPDGRIQYVNRAWKETLGYSDSELVNLTIFDVIHPDSKTHCLDLFHRVMSGESIGHIEMKFVAKNGRVIAAEGNASCRIKNGEALSTRGIFRDVTERKMIDQMKDEFIATVSHELRTPLTSIHGAIGLIKMGNAGEVPPNVIQMLKIAERNSVRLKRMIDDILDMQKIESGDMRFEMRPLELEPLLKHSVEVNESFGEHFNVRFEFGEIPPEIKVNGDRKLLGQVLDNLLTNAAKYSPRNDSVKISVSRRKDKVRVAVKDHGPGIPEEFHSRIFQKFTQADGSMTRERSGSGLGLSIAKSIVERHGGEIGFNTSPGKGTTFYFDLPEWSRKAVRGSGKSGSGENGIDDE